MLRNINQYPYIFHHILADYPLLSLTVITAAQAVLLLLFYTGLSDYQLLLILRLNIRTN